MKDLSIKLEEIKEFKESELLIMDEEFVDYPILEVEIDDVKHAIEACKNNDFETASLELAQIAKFTTSNSIYDTLDDFLKIHD